MLGLFLSCFFTEVNFRGRQNSGAACARVSFLFMSLLRLQQCSRACPTPLLRSAAAVFSSCGSRGCCCQPQQLEAVEVGVGITVKWFRYHSVLEMAEPRFLLLSPFGLPNYMLKKIGSLCTSLLSFQRENRELQPNLLTLLPSPIPLKV